MLRVTGLTRVALENQVPLHTASVDFLLDGQRIWSVDMRNRSGAKRAQFEIPRALRPFLIGTATLSVQDSSNSELLASAPVVFTAEDTCPQIVDELGNPLSINKWGRLAKTLERFSSQQSLILNRSVELISILQDLGKRPFIVGGTLLGAIRDGQLLPHDDDADIAYFSEFSNPTDVAQENFAIARELKLRGYEIVHHGGAHMQLQFIDEETSSDYYIDIFAAFLTPDGFVNQPFHVRGEMRVDQLFPFQQLSVGEFNFPGPADADRWLTVNYDKDWRTPIPGYRLRTKPRTQRRFQNWFGSFNFKRDFWAAFQENADTKQALKAQAEWDNSSTWITNHASALQSPTLLEIGSGTSTLSGQLAHPNKRIIKSDYTSVCRLNASADSSEYIHMNLLRLNVLESLQSLDIQGKFDVVANHVLEQTSHFARRNALRLIRLACESGGTAIATLNGLPAAGVSFDNPTKWHLEPSKLVAECAVAGLFVKIESIEPANPDAHFRGAYAAFFSTAPCPTRSLKLSKLHARAFRRRKVRESLRDWRDQRESIKAFHIQLARLEKQLDDRRRDLLQLAEVVDLVDSHDARRTTIKNVTEVAK